jgi:hypothetical protein
LPKGAVLALDSDRIIDPVPQTLRRYERVKFAFESGEYNRRFILSFGEHRRTSIARSDVSGDSSRMDMVKLTVQERLNNSNV